MRRIEGLLSRVTFEIPIVLAGPVRSLMVTTENIGGVTMEYELGKRVE